MGTCAHVAPPELAALESLGFTRLADVCHSAHLYSFSRPPIEVRLAVASPRPQLLMRVAGLPNGVLGLWWDVAVWEAFTNETVTPGPPPEPAQALALFRARHGSYAEAAGTAGLGLTEKILARLARTRNEAMRRK